MAPDAPPAYLSLLGSGLSWNLHLRGWGGDTCRRGNTVFSQIRWEAALTGAGHAQFSLQWRVRGGECAWEWGAVFHPFLSARMAAVGEETKSGGGGVERPPLLMTRLPVGGQGNFDHKGKQRAVPSGEGDDATAVDGRGAREIPRRATKMAVLSAPPPPRIPPPHCTKCCQPPLPPPRHACRCAKRPPPDKKVPTNNSIQ